MRIGLSLLVFIMASSALAGIGVVAVLVAGLDGWQPLVAAAAIGTLVSIPVTILASRQIR
ncbi:MAG: CTP synthetase [Roseicyclus sp.]